MERDLQKMCEEFEKLKEGDIRTTSWLMRDIKERNCASLHKAFVDHCREFGEYFPDYASLKGQTLGLPWHLPFVKRKKK